MKKMYKFTEAGGKAYGGYEWPLPKKVRGKWVPGEWTEPIEGELVACENGYHITDAEHVFLWMDAEMYEVEYKGELVPSDNGDKYVVRQARLTRKIEKYNDKTLRLFAVWCAREALKLLDNPDPRSVEACNVAERYANGKATKEELAAARDAAWDAARAAAWAAARAAAWYAAWDAAWDAARAAAWAAARDAARAAAWDAAWDAQIKQLFKMLEA